MNLSIFTVFRQHQGERRYCLVEDDEKNESDNPMTEQSLISKMKYMTYSVIMLVVALLTLFLLLGAFHIHQTKMHPTHSPTQCGQSAPEARKLNCAFDLMSFSWLPPACYDGELTEQFLSLRPWHWYHDPDGLVEAPFSAVRTGQYHHLYVSDEYHAYHCTFMWRKMHRAMLSKGVQLDSYVGTYAHTEHCEMMLTKADRDFAAINTTIVTKFPGCLGVERLEGP